LGGNTTIKDSYKREVRVKFRRCDEGNRGTLEDILLALKLEEWSANKPRDKDSQ
jgi:hypothetical protein